MATLNFLRKYFMRKPFFKDGFEYQFVDIQPDEDDASYDFTINVVPPKKGQSYIPTKFTHDIFGMIENSWNYLGSQYSFSENILVNGKKIEYDFIYINEEDTREILNNLNEGIRRVTLESGRHGKFPAQVSADISFSYPKNTEPFYFDSANLRISPEVREPLNFVPSPLIIVGNPLILYFLTRSLLLSSSINTTLPLPLETAFSN